MAWLAMPMTMVEPWLRSVTPGEVPREITP
jgi:hypothetical protein